MDSVYARIFADPEFQALQRRRSRFIWMLALLMVGVFYSFILAIAFAPELLAIPLGPDTIITIGIPIGVGIIFLGFALTGIYAYRANGEFDRANAAIIARLGEGN